MDTIWLVILIPLGVLAAASTLAALVSPRPPRIPVDPERLAQLRECTRRSAVPE